MIIKHFYEVLKWLDFTMASSVWNWNRNETNFISDMSRLTVRRPLSSQVSHRRSATQVLNCRQTWHLLKFQINCNLKFFIFPVLKPNLPIIFSPMNVLYGSLYGILLSKLWELNIKVWKVCWWACWLKIYIPQFVKYRFSIVRLYLSETQSAYVGYFIVNKLFKTS